jgi:hypothetical protein
LQKPKNSGQNYPALAEIPEDIRPGDITKNQNIAITIRQKIEYSLLEKMASLPSGVALSKRSSINIIISLLEKGDKSVVHTCLESSFLTEERLCKLINTPATKPLLKKSVRAYKMVITLPNQIFPGKKLPYANDICNKIHQRIKDR